MKIVVLILAILAGVWVCFNVDFSNFKSNATDTFKKEKTIFGVNNSREQNRAETQEVLNNY